MRRYVKDIVKEVEENEILEAIRKLFCEEVDSVTVAGICPNDFLVLVECAGAELVEELDINGWQFDYWQPCVHNGKRYTISGSGYYGTANLEIEN